jgi:transketolase
MTTTYEDTLLALATADERIMVLTAENRAVIRNLPAKLGDRFVDFGIAEQTMIGAAAGLALRGRIPIAHALATFLILRAYEFVRTDVGIPQLPVKLIGAVPGFLSEANGPTHQAIEDIAVLRAIPGFELYCPSDNAELVAMLPSIVGRHAPAYVRFAAPAPVVTHAPFVVGKAETFGDGTDVAILTYGFLLREALSAQAELSQRGIKARVVNLRTLRPVDTDAIAESAQAKLVVTLEDHRGTGGLATILAEVALARRLSVRHLPIDLGDRFFIPALLANVLAHEGFTGPQIAERIARELDR